MMRTLHFRPLMIALAATSGILVSCSNDSTSESSSFMDNNRTSIAIDNTYTRNTTLPTHNGFSLALSLGGDANTKVLNVCLDRASFLERGFSNNDLGRWPHEKRGVFLSLFNAVQANNPNEPQHPWFDTNIHPFHRGLSAHVDYWAKQHYGSSKNVLFYAYDSLIDNCHVRLVARNSNEAPFNNGGCGAAAGCYTGAREMFINVSFKYETGLTTGQSSSRFMNMTHLIAHEFGHFLGFNHVSDSNSVIYYRMAIGRTEDWQVTTLIPDYAAALFR